MMNPLLRGILDLLYPPRCEACGRLRRDPFCGECRAQVEMVQTPLCRLCGEPFDPRAQGAPTCERCRGRRLPLTIARSAAFYRGPLAGAIRRFKYHGQVVLARPLGSIMIEALDGAAGGTDPSTVGVICPVPLHSSRQRERGFNQSQLLAEEISVAIGKPVIPLLERVRPTAPQVDLPARARAENVRRAFAAKADAGIAGRTVLLIDDLFTTGATLMECGRALKAAGAAEVRVFTLARPLPRWRVPVEDPQSAGTTR
jgi:ComF family protein